jgi:hypothetical protein
MGARPGVGGRRGEAVAGAGAATSARRWCWCPFLARWRVNALALACAGERARRVRVMARLGAGRDRGVAAGNAAEPGPTPWVAASSALAVGSRVRVRRSAGGKACVWRSRERRLFPPFLRPRARGSRPRRGHGGVAVLNAAASPGAREKRPRSSLAPGVDVCVCWGARWRKGVGSAWLRAQ